MHLRQQQNFSFWYDVLVKLHKDDTGKDYHVIVESVYICPGIEGLIGP